MGRRHTFFWLMVLGPTMLMFPACRGGKEDSQDATSHQASDSFDGTSDLGRRDAMPEETAELAASDADAGTSPQPTYWSAEATKTINDLVFVEVDGKPLFALGFDTHSGPVWDGDTSQCGEGADLNYLDIQVEKNQAASTAGANLVYVWSYGELKDTLVAATPPFHGKFHDSWSVDPAPANDVLPVFYNAFGEADMDEPDVFAKAAEMKAQFEDFKARTGKYSLEKMPNLPPYDQLPWFAWHPTYRMIGKGDGTGEMLTPGAAAAMAQSTNMMIGDNYTYIENRFDLSDPAEAIMAAATGQKGDQGEGYEEWVEADDPAHRSYFSAAWDLGHSLVTKRSPGSVVWLWLQGYAFGNGIARDECKGEPNDSWAAGGFPSARYLRKEIASLIAAGATGLIFFGFFDNRWPETEHLLSFFRALSAPEVYGPALLSPRLDVGVDTTYLGPEGYEGLGRAHAIVKWHRASRKAFVIIANPGARDTPIELAFPWTVQEVEALNWDTGGFEEAPGVTIDDRTLRWTMPKDEGMILRIHPLMPPSTLARLHAKGRQIVDPEGHEVRLRGVNLGGWLFHETWITLVDYADHGRFHVTAIAKGMEETVDGALKKVGMSFGEQDMPRVCPANGPEWRAGFQEALATEIGEQGAGQFMADVAAYPALCDDADLPLRLLLEARFGIEGRDELLDAFQKAWIQEDDIKWIADHGFNLVRVPIGYRSLVSNSDKALLTKLTWNEMAFERIADLLDWCERYGIYAVIDIQEAPGGQNTYSGESGLFGDPHMQRLTVELWEYLSSILEDRDSVAAYSLLAEPYGAPDAEARDAMYDLLVKAVRGRGDDHLLVIHDGFMGMASLPSPAELGWDNVVYSTHIFEFQLNSLEGYEFLIPIYEGDFAAQQEKQDVPYFIGSFSTFYDQDWAYDALGMLLGWFEQEAWAWSIWTYKRIDDPITLSLFGYSTQWGVRGRLSSEFDRPDPYLDDKATLLGKLSDYANVSLDANEKLLARLKPVSR